VHRTPHQLGQMTGSSNSNSSSANRRLQPAGAASSQPHEPARAAANPARPASLLTFLPLCPDQHLAVLPRAGQSIHGQPKVGGPRHITHPVCRSGQGRSGRGRAGGQAAGR
jgi:hypothetical protein